MYAITAKNYNKRKIFAIEEQKLSMADKLALCNR